MAPLGWGIGCVGGLESEIPGSLKEYFCLPKALCFARWLGFYNGSISIPRHAPSHHMITIRMIKIEAPLIQLHCKVCFVQGLCEKLRTQHLVRSIAKHLIGKGTVAEAEHLCNFKLTFRLPGMSRIAICISGCFPSTILLSFPLTISLPSPFTIPLPSSSWQIWKAAILILS